MVVIRVLLLYYLLERMPSAQRHELGEYGRSPQKEMLARIFGGFGAWFSDMPLPKPHAHRPVNFLWLPALLIIPRN